MLVLILAVFACCHRITALYEEDVNDDDIFQSCLLLEDGSNIHIPRSNDFLSYFSDDRMLLGGDARHGSQVSMATSTPKENWLKNMRLISSRKKDMPKSGRTTLFIGRKKRDASDLSEKRFSVYFKFPRNHPRIPIWKALRMAQRQRMKVRRTKRQEEEEHIDLQDALPYLGAYVENVGKFLAGDRDLAPTVNQLRCMERKLEEKRHARNIRSVKVQENNVDGNISNQLLLVFYMCQTIFHYVT